VSHGVTNQLLLRDRPARQPAEERIRMITGRGADPDLAAKIREQGVKAEIV
jgi:hypothetical protein